MKKILLLSIISLVIISCKQGKNEHLETHISADETIEVKKDFKIKSVTRKDYLAEYKFGEYIQGKQLNTITRRFNEESLPYEIEIKIESPDDMGKVAGDTLSKDPSDSNLFKYTPKRNGNKIEMFGEDGTLAEILVMKDNAMFGYTADNDKEPFVVRKYDDIGNYVYQVINTGDEFLYVTKHTIIEKDENGFAKKTNAMWFQYKKRADIDYNNIDFSALEVVDKNYQVVEFDFEI